MQITNLKIRKLIDNKTTMKAVVSVTLDNQLAIHDIKVIHANERYFIVMPCKKESDGAYRDVVHPINSEFRGYLEAAIVDAYDRALELAKAGGEPIEVCDEDDD